jgi:DNA mismatch repair protein MutL
MTDIIKIFPDSVANQIAAGEVIQRPASVVKELLENSIDAGATEISLIVKDAGRTLIQVTDNGIGMSETDVRLSFERHATSKIKESKDLFSIRTMGFRGEALASIAAISQVEIKTKRKEDTLGTSVKIDASKFIKQEECNCNDGTTISVKNIFFNVPARRNFLKSDQVEVNHIIEEFQRVAIAFTEVAFTFYHNGNELFHLQEKSTLKQRISSLFGKQYNERLIPVEQSTEYIKINGFIGKPEFAKKNRGEQYFFINNRFIKHSYLNHALINAYFELIPTTTYPSYFIFFEIDPKAIDINIHPTKTEIKFQDEKMIYAVLFSSVKQSLGKFNISPTIDFEVERSFDLPHSYKDKIASPPQIKINPDYNPFDKGIARTFEKKETPLEKINKENWEKLYSQQPTESKQQQIISPGWDSSPALLSNKNVIQINEKYIISRIKSGVIIINQQSANERIFYEHFLKLQENKTSDIQQQLFPQQIELSAKDAKILKDIKTEIEILGFDINEFGQNTFVINGIPADLNIENINEFIESCIESYSYAMNEIDMDKKTNIALSMAKSISKKLNKQLDEEEILSIIDRLFECKVPNITPDGKKIFTVITFDEIENKLK